MSGCCGSNQLGLGRPLLQPWVGGVRCFHMAQRVALDPGVPHCLPCTHPSGEARLSTLWVLLGGRLLA